MGIQTINLNDRYPCKICFKTLDPNISDVNLRSFVRCTTCGHIFHATCVMRIQVCTHCYSSAFQQIVIQGSIPELCGIKRKPIHVYEPSLSEEERHRKQKEQKRTRRRLGYIALLLIISIMIVGIGVFSALYFETINERTITQLTAAARTQDVTVAYEIYDRAHKQTNLDNGVKELTQLITTNPSNAYLYAFRADLYLDLGETQLASQDIDIALNIDKNEAVYFAQGFLRFNNRQFEFAIESFERSLEIDPTFALSHYGLCLQRYRIDQLTLAESDCNNAIRIDPEMFWGYYGRSIVMVSRGNYDQALDDINQAIAIAPNKPALYNQRGEVFLYREEYNAAVVDYNRALAYSNELITQANSYFGLGLVYLEQENIESSVNSFCNYIDLVSDPRQDVVDFISEVGGC